MTKDGGKLSELFDGEGLAEELCSFGAVICVGDFAYKLHWDEACCDFVELVGVALGPFLQTIGTAATVKHFHDGRAKADGELVC